MPDTSIDVVLLFYVLHDFKNPDSIIRELVGTLKPKAILAVIDHKFDNDKIVSTISHATGILKLNDKEQGQGDILNFFKARILGEHYMNFKCEKFQGMRVAMRIIPHSCHQF